MTRVILIRHAKSDWGTGGPDHERPLNARGRDAADRVGRWLASSGFLPDRVLCSTAARTTETCERLLAAANHAPDVTFDRTLYHAAPMTMLTALEGITVGTVALIGHNPGIAMLAEGLVEMPPDHARFDDYPTGATTVIDFDGPIELNGGRCHAFVIPRELPDG